MKALKKQLVQAGILFGLLGSMMVLGGIVEGGLAFLPGFCVLILLAAGIRGLSGLLCAAGSRPVRQAGSVNSAASRPAHSCQSGELRAA